MAVSKRLRYEVLRRDNHTCRYCGQSAPDVKLAVDHVTPVALGGSDDPSNLIAACVDCNAGKSASSPDAELVADVDERAVRWAQAVQVAVKRRMAELAAERGRTDRFDQEWRRWHGGNKEVPRDPAWRQSVLRLLAAGLSDDFLIDAVGIAMQSKASFEDKWRYFCGVCWREADKIQEMARGIADAGSGDAWTEAINYEMSPAEEAEWEAERKAAREDFAVREAYLAVLRGIMAKLGASDDLLHEMSRIVVEARDASIKFHDYGVSNSERYEKAYADLERHVTAALASVEFPKPPHEPEFAYMEMFDEFTSDLVVALGGDEQVVKFVDHVLWQMMPEAHDEWRYRLSEQDEYFAPDEETEHEYATRMAREYVSGSTAPHMYEIAQWRKAKDQASGS